MSDCASFCLPTCAGREGWAASTHGAAWCCLHPQALHCLTFAHGNMTTILYQSMSCVLFVISPLESAALPRLSGPASCRVEPVAPSHWCTARTSGPKKNANWTARFWHSPMRRAWTYRQSSCLNIITFIQYNTRNNVRATAIPYLERQLSYDVTQKHPHLSHLQSTAELLDTLAQKLATLVSHKSLQNSVGLYTSPRRAGQSLGAGLHSEQQVGTEDNSPPVCTGREG